MKRDYWPTLQWKEAVPEAVGMSSVKLSLLNVIIQSGYDNLNGIIVIRKGCVVWEKYYHRKNAKSMHNVASVAKSIISALIGIAIQKGCIKNVDEKVLSFFPEYNFDFTQKQKLGVTLRHLLTMTAPFSFRNWHEPLNKMRQQSNWARYCIGMLGQGGRIGTFKYSTAGTHLLSAVITRATSKCAREFANEYLFCPIGMPEIKANDSQAYELEDVFGRRVHGWIHDPNGHSAGGFGLTLTLRDMARFGYLYLNMGEWDGKQIVPDAWVTESTAKNANMYGYLWWLRTVKGFDAYAAMGDGGNMICCIPEKDLVIAIASRITRHCRNRWPLIENIILPAVLE